MAGTLNTLTIFIVSLELGQNLSIESQGLWQQFWTYSESPGEGIKAQIANTHHPSVSDSAEVGS